MGLLRQKQEPTPAPTPVRTSATIRAELGVAEDSLQPLHEKMSAAQSELTSAQQRYDAGVQAFALGESHAEPDRGELQAAVSKADALQRITRQQESAVQDLTGELQAAELAEAIIAGRERLTPLRALTETKFEQFSTALAAAKAAEKELFNLLFDQGSGLKQRFPSAELQTEATKVRHSLRNRVEEVAGEFGFAINSRFETDGEINLGQENSEYFYRQLLRR